MAWVIGISGQVVTCRGIEKDRYGRIVAKCYANGMDLGRELVRRGLAIAYRYFSMDYAADEDAARASRPAAVHAPHSRTPNLW
jgi:endonuclease YncB( thermonuclease family)